MSRTIKGSKPIGCDYWSKRIGNKGGANGCSSYAKHYTHKRERLESKRISKKECDTMNVE